MKMYVWELNEAKYIYTAFTVPVVIPLALRFWGVCHQFLSSSFQITRKTQRPHLLYSFSNLHITLLKVLINKLQMAIFFVYHLISEFT